MKEKHQTQFSNHSTDVHPDIGMIWYTLCIYLLQYNFIPEKKWRKDDNMSNIKEKWVYKRFTNVSECAGVVAIIDAENKIGMVSSNSNWNVSVSLHSGRL